MGLKVLLAADEIGGLLRIANLLRAQDYNVEICNEVSQFCEAARTIEPDACVLSIVIPSEALFAEVKRLRQASSTSQFPLLLVAPAWEEIAPYANEMDWGKVGLADDYILGTYSDAEFEMRIRGLARLADQRRERTRREAELAALKHVSEAASGLPDLDALLKAALDRAMSLLDVESSGVYIFSSDREKNCRLELAYHQGLSEDFANLIRHLYADTLFLPAHTPHVCIKSVSDYHHPVLKAALVNEGYQVVGEIPLLARGELQGLITFGSRRSRSFGEKDRQLMAAIGHQVGLALETIDLYDALQREKDFANRMLDTMAEGLLLEDELGNITFVNPAICELLGYKMSDLSQLHVLDIVWPGEKARLRAEHAQRQIGLSGCYEITLRSAKGHRVPVVVNATPILQEGEYQGALSVFADIVALKEAQRASRESEERYRVLAEESPFGILIVNGQDVLYANKRMSQWWPANADLEDIFSRVEKADKPRLSKWLSRQAAGEKPEPIEVQVRSRGRSGSRWFVLRGGPVRYGSRRACLITLLDVTEQRLADQALLHTERLRALGQMAGGIAHNFNNILAGIQGHLDLAQEDLDNPAALAEHLEQIALGTRDAAQAVKRLQSLYRAFDDKSDMVPLQIQDVIKEAIALTRPRWWDDPQRQGVRVELHSDLTPSAPVVGNAGELREVLTNLIFNAVDAMPEGGEISIALEAEEQAISLCVQDTGVGMTEEQMARVWEPFYTTKGETGSGLGLSISQRIIERHGGTISVESQVGRGTIFTIRLPTTEAPVPEASAPTRCRDVESGYHILVVDDEPTVAKILRRMLTRQGQEVKLASSGQEALDALESEAFSLVITDLGMPDVSGQVVARRSRELYPNVPVVLATGWGDTITPEQLEEMGVQGLLPKPFTYSQVRRILSQHLVQSQEKSTLSKKSSPMS